MKITSLTAVLLAFSVFFVSCSREKSSDASKAQLKVFLTDDPAAYGSVVIDVRDVQINVTGDSTNGWQSLSSVAAGRYDLLSLVNDDDTLLANSDIPSGRLEQMRLVLGPNNFIVVDGTTYPLETPSAQQSGLKLNIHQDVTAGVLYTITLDFDAARSIVKTGNNRYILKPVIRTTFNAAGGSIKGVVSPNSFSTLIYAIKGTDSVSTYTDATGGYLVRGLPAGTYTLRFIPGDTTYVSETRTGVNVTVGNVTTVDTVHLHH
ncbi:MAG: hypothetical protein C4308_00680 [Chitinophagaceae bacterium]